MAAFSNVKSCKSLMLIVFVSFIALSAAAEPLESDQPDNSTIMSFVIEHSYTVLTRLMQQRGSSMDTATALFPSGNSLDEQSSNSTSVIRRGLQSSPIVSGTNLGQLGTYYVRPRMGSKGREFYLSMDTGSALTWMQCQPCDECFEQLDMPVFDPAVDTETLKEISVDDPVCRSIGGRQADDGPGCRFTQPYSDSSSTNGKLVTDLLSLPSGHGITVYFGCSHRSHGTFRQMAGILGLNRNFISFTGQMRRRGLPTMFSYCLPRMYSDESTTLTFGGPIPPRTTFTPLLHNRVRGVYQFYVQITGISVNGEQISVPAGIFDIDTESGDGGAIIDSGAYVTRLHRRIHNPLRDAVRAAIYTEANQLVVDKPLKPFFDSCYLLKGGVAADRTYDGVPTVVFHLRDGAELQIPPQNVLVPLQKPDHADKRICMSFSLTRSQSPKMTVIGNLHQMGVQLTFDDANNRVGFTPHGAC
ncbi:hypothetical protein L7F22_016418 [Adiantum nelumboides]|nr:hypothetical protein [Adiantum nelumboides]